MTLPAAITVIARATFWYWGKCQLPQKCATHFREKKNMYQAPSKFCIICQLQAIGVLHKFRGYGASAREASTYISLVLFRSMFFLSFLNYCHTNNYIMYSHFCLFQGYLQNTRRPHHLYTKRNHNEYLIASSNPFRNTRARALGENES